VSVAGSVQTIGRPVTPRSGDQTMAIPHSGDSRISTPHAVAERRPLTILFADPDGSGLVEIGAGHRRWLSAVALLVARRVPRAGPRVTSNASSSRRTHGPWRASRVPRAAGQNDRRDRRRPHDSRENSRPFHRGSVPASRPGTSEANGPSGSVPPFSAPGHATTRNRRRQWAGHWADRRWEAKSSRSAPVAVTRKPSSTRSPPPLGPTAGDRSRSKRRPRTPATFHGGLRRSRTDWAMICER
jgi:hypothetical protein